MAYFFDDEFRKFAAARCAAFSPLAVIPVGTLKHAAVAIAIAAADNGSEAAILLTRRAANMRAHRGQWALPGGRMDAGETAAGAALRELGEELGLALGADAVLGLLDSYVTRSGYLIEPVVIWAGTGADIRPNALEVASVHRVPIANLAAPDAVSFVSIPESDRPVIRLRYEDRFVHAPTAAVIYQFVEVLAGRDTRVRDYEQPVFAWE